MKKVIKLTNMDFPDPDVIRVGDTYYMISTTMHFCPGAQILSSKDLVHWQHSSYVYDIPEVTPARCLENASHIYGKGMWAASLRYHDGVFYVCFVANDTHKTYLYRATSVEGPWVMNEIEGFYHDCSLLFDDGRVFIVYGNTQIYITELNDSLTGPKKGGLNKMIIEDGGDIRLGYEGAHLYKLNGKYYLFLIHWPNTVEARRTESCFVADSLEGEWFGKDIYDWDGGFRHSGVAQGGIVDTPEGDYFAIMFQDSGAVGRIPVLVPLEFIDGWPVLCEEAEEDYGNVIHQRKGEELFCSGFTAKENSRLLNPLWQWNHIPSQELWDVSDNDVLTIRTDKIVQTLTCARNILTQRMIYPSCWAQVCVNGNEMNDGDFAGICVLEGSFGLVALHKKEGKFYLTMRKRTDNKEVWGFADQDSPDELMEEIAFDGPIATLRIDVSFEGKDEAIFYYQKNNEWIAIGEMHPLVFRLDHFSGCRFGIFQYSTQMFGGSACFSNFRYECKNLK